MRSLDHLRWYARTVKLAGRLLTRRDRIYRYDVRPKREFLGTIYGGWTIAPEYLDSSSAVYSFGVGNDISFDLALIDRFGLYVHGFDPSPKAIAWLASQNLPDKYSFHPYGLGIQDGDISFFAPREGGMYSLSAQHKGVSTMDIELPVHTLSTIVQSLNTSRIDILKMDIEGAEYDLLTAVLACPVPIKQLLIEFHHRIGVESLQTTVACVEELKAQDFQLFKVSETGSEFSFLHK